ncbi:phage integrase family protein [Roseimicrobium gellanilyticum]|uniref:Phage integrase family protein n=1 Tax=Roseimicrobium gellanilyticum TaxID=748857 RepID=A0A366HAS4_9BACT|nr:tyrosine-type recombinase/integrase [Roseimicrobium gellanilyticum]RBP38581.1 phage integrase family protein [Roseimicrobium gellanilyticum]
MHSKTDIRHWRSVVFRPKVSKSGREIQQLYVKIQYRGRRETFALQTNNQDKAAEKARQIYLSLVAKGWDETLAERKPKKHRAAGKVATVGDLIKVASERSDIERRTVADYCRAFRLIVGHILGMGAAPRNSSRDDLRRRQARIDQTMLSSITTLKIEQWRHKILATAASKGPSVSRRAKNSLNSQLRQAKSLFSGNALKYLEEGKLIHNPFEGVGLEPRQSMRYHSEIDLDHLIDLALHGNKERDIDRLPSAQLKVFLLAALAGLRRNEIDKLEWSSFRWDENTIRLQATDYFRPKTEESLGDVNVDRELMHALQTLRGNSTSAFVVEAPSSPRLNVGYSAYRCTKVFDATTKWLRNAGVNTRTPLHTLRKEFGSLMCSRYGIYVASRALRHRDIHITSQHYVDTKQRLVPGLSGALAVVRSPTA